MPHGMLGKKMLFDSSEMHAGVSCVFRASVLVASVACVNNFVYLVFKQYADFYDKN